jgi:hypothetical protein
MNQTTTSDKYAHLSVKHQTVIEAYYLILADIVGLLKQYPTDQTRTFVINDRSNDVLPHTHNVFSPMFLLSLTVDIDHCQISFCKNQEIRWYVSQYHETAFIRAIYKHTMAEHTKINIEDCVEEYCYCYPDYHEAELRSATDTTYQLTTYPPIEEEA